MEPASLARQLGDEYQAYVFWMYAAEMLRPTAQIAHVGYEVADYRAFDDVAIRYAKPRLHAHGIEVTADHLQVKFSVSYGKALTAEALVDPAFSGGQTVSLLDRLKDAVEKAENAGASHRFVVLTPRPVDPRDALARLLNSTDGSIRIPVLFEGKTARSRMGTVRDLWASKLGLADQAQLAAILRRLKIDVWPDNLQKMVGDMNARLAAGGLAPWPDANRASPYPNLITTLRAEGSSWFGPNDIRAAAQHDGLLAAKSPSQPPRVQLGIRSFLRWAEGMEDETDDLLDLTQHFVDRQIKAPALWSTAILPETRAFLRRHMRTGQSYLLHLRALTSVAFLTGYLIDPKMGVDVGVIQPSSQEPWVAIPGDVGQIADRWSATSTKEAGDGQDLAVGIAVSQSVAADVRAYLQSARLPVAGALQLTLETGPSRTAIQDGTEAFAHAQQAVNHIREFRFSRGLSGTVHLFLAAPNGFTFFLGQLARPLGPLRLYEYRYGSGAPGAYTASVELSHTVTL